MENIIENNRLIAEFMGAEFINLRDFERVRIKNPDQKTKTSKVIKIENLKYYCDWNWLMPVISKIESHTKDKQVIHWSRNNNTIYDVKLSEANIEQTYKLVIEFIKWYSKTA